MRRWTRAWVTGVISEPEAWDALMTPRRVCRAQECAELVHKSDAGPLCLFAFQESKALCDDSLDI